jgi:hypothetical protein
MVLSNYGRIHASTAQLFSLTTALIALQILRALVLFLRILRLPGPPRIFQSWIDSTEYRIFRIVPSLTDLNANEPRRSIPSSSDKHRSTIPRGDGPSEHSTFDGPFDVVIAPAGSSLPSTEPSREMSTRGEINTRPKYQFRPSQPRYQEIMSRTKSAVILPTYTGMSPRAINLSANLDGVPITLPPVPTYLSRMSYNSVSDSIYSSGSNGPISQRNLASTTSSIKGTAPAAAHVYTDLLPKRPIFSSTSNHSSRQYSMRDKLRSSSIVRSEMASLAKTMAQFPDLSGTTSSFPGNFPVSDDLEYSSLATVSQHVADSEYFKTRPLSAPTFRLGDRKEKKTDPQQQHVVAWADGLQT